MLISLLSFSGGIERREGLGLYYHTLWTEGWGEWMGGGAALLKQRDFGQRVILPYPTWTGGHRRRRRGELEEIEIWFSS